MKAFDYSNKRTKMKTVKNKTEEEQSVSTVDYQRFIAQKVSSTRYGYRNTFLFCMLHPHDCALVS